ncbi:MAG: hypothetical protein FJZ43_04745 [Candidatus Staskawiczbacteria bacterium]|nr:hypothetical protein [Candidatus Staskawiczbacteria bacterium]
MGKSDYEDNFVQFNLDDFKKWMDGQQEESPYRKNLVGMYVESKVSIKKLMSRMEAENEEGIKEVAKDFQENGGVIKEVDGHYFKISVETGDFLIHRMFVKRPD